MAGDRMDPNMTKLLPAFGAALILAAAAAPAAAQPPAQPQARWHLDGATNRCVLTRRLDGSPAPATFVLRTIPGSGVYDVMLAGRELPGEIRRARRQTSIALAPGGKPHAARATTIDLGGDLGQAIAIGPLPADFAADFARAQTLALADQGRALGTWTIPAAAAAARAFASCEAEKQVDWGADPAAVAPGATPPRPLGDSHGWLSLRDLGLADSLGTAAIAAVFRLVIDAQGRATACTILESAGNVQLPAAACRSLVRRARYEPARDPSGNPVTSVTTYTVAVRTETEVVVTRG